MTISNRLSIALVAVFLPFAAMAGLSIQDIGLHAACGFGVLVITFTMFAMGWIGGGDAKLAAATALWVGWDHLLDFSLDSTLFGGALTLGILAVRQVPMPRFAVATEWIMRLHERGAGVPYGIALAAAGLVVYPDTGLWAAAVAV